MIGDSGSGKPSRHADGVALGGNQPQEILLLVQDNAMASLLQRYMSGETAEVWDELIRLDGRVRMPEVFEDAYGVAKATMWRVRADVTRIKERLGDAGYRFRNPKRVIVPPSEDTPALIRAFEEERGPMPLSLRAFYETVGSLDFRQSPDQLVHHQHPRRSSASEIEMLGEEDPLYVAPLEELIRESEKWPRQFRFCFAPDEFHKANYSGGENYHVGLPDPSADFLIDGMYEVAETFVAYLRASLANGGFRGRVETLPDNDQVCRKVTPKLSICRTLAADLRPI